MTSAAFSQPRSSLFRVLLLANLLPAMLCAIIAAAGILGFGGALDLIGWLFVLSPLFLALWLASATGLLDRGARRVAIAMLGLPVLLSTGVLGFVVLER